MTKNAQFTLSGGAAGAPTIGLALGAYWDASGINWSQEPGEWVLVAIAEEDGFPSRDITYTSAWYALFNGDELLHIGRSDGVLYAELRRHRLASAFTGRWNRFTWIEFPESDLLGGPSSNGPGSNPKISLQHVLDLFEEGFELPPPPIGPSRPLRYPFPVLRFRQGGMSPSIQEAR